MCKENIENAKDFIKKMFEKRGRTVLSIMLAYEDEETSMIDHNITFVIVSAYGSLYKCVWWVNDNVYHVHGLDIDSENAFYERGC